MASLQSMIQDEIDYTPVFLHNYNLESLETYSYIIQIKKLLQLASKLHDELIQEKNEKAELEMKMKTQMLKQEEERQSLITEQEFRIKNLERMYENVIKEYDKELLHCDIDESSADINDSLSDFQNFDGYYLTKSPDIEMREASPEKENSPEILQTGKEDSEVPAENKEILLQEMLASKEREIDDVIEHAVKLKPLLKKIEINMYAFLKILQSIEAKATHKTSNLPKTKSSRIIIKYLYRQIGDKERDIEDIKKALLKLQIQLQSAQESCDKKLILEKETLKNFPTIPKSPKLLPMQHGSKVKPDEMLKTKENIKEKENVPKKFKEALEFEELYENYVKDVRINESETRWKFTSYNKSVIKKLTSFKMTKIKNITTLAWYPSADCLVLAAGCKSGNLEILNTISGSNPYAFINHTGSITNLQFNPLNRVQLVSSSYDGSLCLGDMVKHTFEKIYSTSESVCCTYFDFLSQATYLVAQRNGQVVLVDNRTQGKGCGSYSCHNNCITSVDVHPVNKNYFVTSENKGSICIWDLRKLQEEPVAEVNHHEECVNSSFFSPNSGSFILATSADNTISIFDCSSLNKDIKLKKQIEHNNFTKQWLSVLRATWLPNSEETFVIGSVEEPRQLELFNIHMDSFDLIRHEKMTIVPSTNALHPCRPALAGGNSSSKVFVLNECKI